MLQQTSLSVHQMLVNAQSVECKGGRVLSLKEDIYYLYHFLQNHSGSVCGKNVRARSQRVGL